MKYTSQTPAARTYWTYSQSQKRYEYRITTTQGGAFNALLASVGRPDTSSRRLYYGFNHTTGKGMPGFVTLKAAKAAVEALAGVAKAPNTPRKGKPSGIPAMGL